MDIEPGNNIIKDNKEINNNNNLVKNNIKTKNDIFIDKKKSYTDIKGNNQNIIIEINQINTNERNKVKNSSNNIKDIKISNNTINEKNSSTNKNERV